MRESHDEHAARVLWAVLGAVGDGGSYTDILYRLCRVLVDALPCDRATVYTLAPRAGVFLPRADHGTPAEVVEAFIRRGFAAETYPDVTRLAEGEVVVVSRDAPRDAQFARLLEDAKLHAMAVVPMLFAGDAEGVLSCGLHQAPGFSDEQIAVLQGIARHVAVLIRLARLEADAARRARRRTWLASWAAQVLAATDVDALAAQLAAASRDLFRASGAWLLLVEDGVLVSRRLQADGMGGIGARLTLDAPSASAEALRTGRVLIVNDYLESTWAGAWATESFQPASILAVPLADAEGPLGVLTVHDLGEPRRFGPTDAEDAQLLGAIATAALRKLLLVQALTRASAAKSDFLASVSHDLRTPLNIIVGYSQLLAEEALGPLVAEQADALQRVLRTAGEQLNLISDLLDLARIEQGKLSCSPRPLPVASLVPSLREMMEALLRGRPVQFEVDVAFDAVATADPERLRQILVNLLANAAKFTHEGCVRLVARQTAADVEIVVEDTGAGMEPDLASRVLEPFVAGKGSGAGSGLGLAIVAQLLRLQGGDIRIDSRPGEGTRVGLRLPAGVATRRA